MPLNMFLRLIVFSIAFISTNLFSQGIRGKIVDETAAPAPGVSIYFKEIRTGTTTNIDGLYEIPLPEGVYTVIFQAMGFAKQESRITIKDKWIEQDIKLLPVQFKLKEVTVYSGEDPAYPIMRKAIGLAPYYLRQVKNYESEIYLKGTIEVKKIPKLFGETGTVGEDKMEEGKTYTSESINKVRFAAPDTVKHTVISARTSFPGDSQEGMVMDYLNMSFYESDNELYISPLSPQALRHYNFRYEGFIDEGQYTVNCIKVIPKRKSQQLWEGNLYIVENLWCIYSVDLSLNLFLGKMKINQLYSEVKEKVWLPVTNLFDINFSMFGVKIDFAYTGAVKYLSVNTNDNQKIKALEIDESPVVEKEEVDKKANLSKNQKKIEEILSKDEMTNRDMTKLAGLIEKENKPDRKDIDLEIKTMSSLKFKRILLNVIHSIGIQCAQFRLQ
jgi:hypothetical protein